MVFEAYHCGYDQVMVGAFDGSSVLPEQPLPDPAVVQALKYFLARRYRRSFTRRMKRTMLGFLNAFSSKPKFVALQKVLGMARSILS